MHKLYINMEWDDCKRRGLSRDRKMRRADKRLRLYYQT